MFLEVAPVTLAERDALKSLAKKFPTSTFLREKGRPPAPPALPQFMTVARDGPTPPASNIFPAGKGGLPLPPPIFMPQMGYGPARPLSKDLFSRKLHTELANRRPKFSAVGFKATGKGEHPPTPQSLSFQSEIKDSTKLPATPGGVPPPLPPPIPPPIPLKEQQPKEKSAAARYEPQGEKS